MSARSRELAVQVADWVAKGATDEAARLIEVSSASPSIKADAYLAEIKWLRGELSRVESLLSGRPEAESIAKPPLVGSWILWKRLGSGRMLIEEHFCQAIRGGTVAELVSEPPFSASADHPRLEILSEMAVLTVSTSEERAAEIAARVPVKKKTEAGA